MAGRQPALTRPGERGTGGRRRAWMGGGRSPAAALLLVSCVNAASAQDRPTPYWASIARGEAIMRSGPDRSYPAIWLYRRRDLPVRVLQIEGVWRRVQEPDGTTGWMQSVLLSARRTVMVRSGYRPIRADRSDEARLLWQAEAGVLGRIDKCDGAWCRIEIGAHRGYIRQAGLYGVASGETVD